MQPCDELENIVLHHYGEFDSGTQVDSVKEVYSLQEGVTIIGNDPNEWFDDRDSIVAFMNAGSAIRWKSPSGIYRPIRKAAWAGLWIGSRSDYPMALSSRCVIPAFSTYSTTTWPGGGDCP